MSDNGPWLYKQLLGFRSSGCRWQTAEPNCKSCIRPNSRDFINLESNALLNNQKLHKINYLILPTFGGRYYKTLNGCNSFWGIVS